MECSHELDLDRTKMESIVAYTDIRQLPHTNTSYAQEMTYVFIVNKPNGWAANFK